MDFFKTLLFWAGRAGSEDKSPGHQCPKEHAPRTSRGRGRATCVCSQALPKGRTVEKVFGASVRFSALSLLPPLPHPRPRSLFSALTRNFLLWGTRVSRWGNMTRQLLLTISDSHMLPPITMGVRAAPGRGQRQR